MMAIEFITGKDVERLNNEELRSVLNALLNADASQHRVPLSDLKISTRNNDKDAGIDAWIKWPDRAQHEMFSPGENVVQYKSGKLTEKLLKEEFEKEGVQRVLKGGGYYLFCAGHDYVKQSASKHEKTLKELCRKKKIPAQRARIIFGSALARWICRYPAVVARPELRKHVREFITVDRWQSDNAQLSNPFRPDESRKETIEQIRTFLRSDSPGSAILRLEGPAGVGKTRLALEAVKQMEYASRTLYAINAENAEVQPFLMAVYSDPETAAIAVIDECSRTRQSTVEQYAQLSKGRLKLICVGVHEIVYETPPPALTPVYQLRPLPDADIEVIVRDSFRSAPKDHIDMGVRLSGGYVKLAMFITATLERWGATPPTELAKVMEIQEFLRKFVDAESRQALQVLSVLGQIGWDAELREEAKTVAEFVHLPMATLERAVSRLRKQGVVIPKGRYLYVSPDLLAIQAAADLWSEKEYRLLELISELKGKEPREQMLVRLARMGEYQEMKTAVGGIISREGLYQKLSDLDQEFLSEVFRILSAAVPVAAADLLVELIVPASKDDLLGFNTGRRNVIWSIESLLRWPETSMKAARALMKLALSETEKISNNATSVFEQFFQLFLSGSPVPLTERFTLVEELLESEDPNCRLLAVRAVASSLRAQEVRFGGDTDYLSKRKYPAEWRPKTYEEVWDARRRSLAYLDEIGGGSDQAADLARREKLGSIYALVGQGQVADAIEVLAGAAARNDEERRIIIRSSDQILGVPNLTEQQRATVTQIRDSAFGTSYFDRIRRWVGTRTFGDFDSHGESGFEAADRRVVELAEEGFQNEIEPEVLEWLSSPQAENVWIFGRRLGEIDSVEKFGKRILHAAPDDVNCVLFAAYAAGRALSSGQEDRERLLDAAAEVKAAAAFGATWRGDATVAGVERIIRLVSEGRVPPSELRMLRYGGWVEKLPFDYASRIIDLMLTLAPGATAESVLGIIDHAVRAGTIPVERFGETIWKALEILRPERSTMIDWYWARVADLVASEDPKRIAAIFVRFFESDQTWLNTDSAQGVMRLAVRSDPSAVWEVVGARLLGNDLTAVRLRLKLEGWFGDLFPPEVLVEWARQNGQRGFLVAASLLNSKTDSLSGTARLLVKEAENPKEVLNQFFANLTTGTFVGPMSSHMRDQLSTLKKWALDPEPIIKAWAEGAITSLEKGLKRQALLEEEEGVP
jgi:hypothetical protein